MYIWLIDLILFVGDIGYYDENKFLFIVDRIKELIKHKGQQVTTIVLLYHCLLATRIL